MSRWKAAGIHLSISLLIGLIVGALLFGVWYPPPYCHAAGADQLVLLLVSVDIVLGPLLTLVVFKSGKWGLKFDLTLIAVMQTVALVYGLSVVLRSRPVFLVAAVDRFVLVSASEINDVDLAQGSKPEFQSLSWTGPRTVGAELPPRGAARDELMMSGMAGQDIEKFPKYYADYPKVAPDLLKRAKTLDQVPTRPAGAVEALAAAVKKTGQSADRLVWLPIVARKANLVMLLDRESGEPLHAAPIDPWAN